MFILQKTSTIKCNISVSNQCKDVGHPEYDYDVKLYTAEVLDDRGFIIDHTDVHNVVRRVFETQMGSCEQLSLRIGKALKIELDKFGIPVKVIDVMIKPVGSNAYISYYKKFKKKKKK